MIEAVIFDMDGVLIDSIASVYRVKSKILKDDYDIDIVSVPDPHNEAHKGGSITTLLTAVQESTGVHIDESEFTDKIVTSVYNDLKENHVSADPDLLDLLNDLKSRNIPMAVATSASRQSTNNKLRILGLDDFFDEVITTDDIKEHKPHPESYLAALQRLGASPAKSIVFEDSAAGIQAGNAAGAKVIGITKYNSDKSTLVNTALTVNDWNDVSYDKLESLVV
ncbi:MAG TPA: HAD family phosphatase [Candidatus Saccharimonadales bacterium]